MIPYILYTSIILSACLIFYKLLLQKETFFNLNRFVLLTCMMLAFLLPVIPVPQQMSFRKTPGTSNLISNETTIIKTAAAEKTNTAPAVGGASQKSSSQNLSLINAEQVKQWLVYLYWFGVVVFGLNFLVQAAVLLYTAHSRPVIKDGRFRIVEVTGDKAPCSFGNNIFINPEKYDWDTYNQVLLHEKIHIEQRHTLDLLLAEIVLVFQWFNPFAWFWRKELESNLEFFTDRKLLQQDSIEKETYQLSLLKVAAPHFPLSLTTNYNQSLLKKRLLMMNAKKSNVHTMWKYFFLVPLMVAFVCLFNEPVINAQNSTSKAKPKAHPTGVGFKTSGNWFATIKNDTIKIEFKNDDDVNSYNGHSFKLSEFKNLPRDQQGSFSLTREAGTTEFTGKFDGDKGMGSYKFVPNKTFSADMIKEGIDVSDDRDLMVFFLVDLKTSYVQMLKKNGYTDIEKDKLIPLAALDVNEGYLKSIKAAGFAEVSLDELVPLRALNVDKAYIEEIRGSGYKDISPDKIITFKAQGIDGKYITDFRNSSTKDKGTEKDEAGDANEIDNANKNLKNNTNVGKNKDLNKHLNHNANNDEDDIVAFKAMNIDNAFINSFKDVGYNNLSHSDLISMKALNVTPEYVKSFRDAGYSGIKPDELVSLKAQEVTPAVIKAYKDLGFADVSLDDVIGAKATGTSPAFIKSMREKGHKMTSLNKYIALKSVLGE